MGGPKNYAIVLLALTTLGAGYLAWSQAREITDLKASLAAAANQPQVIARKHAWAAPHDTPSDAPAMALRDKANAPQHADEARAPGFRNRRQSEEKFRELMENPEYQKLMAVEQKGRLDFAYAALFKKLGLTPTQLEKFKELLVEKQASFSDVFTAASAQGLDPRTDPQGFRALVKSAQDDIDSSIRAALGDTAYDTYKTYQQTMPYRGIVNQLDTRLSYSASPLTDAQSEQLVQIVADSNQPAGQSNPQVVFSPTVDFRTGAGPSPLLNNDAMSRAQGILTPDQFTALQQLQQEHQAQAQMRNLMRQQFQQTRINGSAPLPAATLPIPATPASTGAQ